MKSPGLSQGFLAPMQRAKAFGPTRPRVGRLRDSLREALQRLGMHVGSASSSTVSTEAFQFNPFKGLAI